MLVKYIREGNQLVGAVVAVGPGQVGWSLRHPTKEHRVFSKQRALEIAVGRAEKGTNAVIPTHREDVMFEAISEMMDRSFKYFK